jgi:hypothetical protein
MGRSQCGIASAWHEAAFPGVVHAAAITGVSMDESKATTVVMDKIRRMIQMPTIARLSSLKQWLSIRLSY